MNNRQKELAELFSMFHDFDIVAAQWRGSNLVFFFTIPWGSMWKSDDYSYTIQLELLDCSYYNFEYYKIKSKNLIKIAENRYQKDTERIVAENPEDLPALQLSIQSSTHLGNGNFELYCISLEDIDYALIAFSVNDYRLYDPEGKEIALATLDRWCTEWWDSIHRMWDEQA